MSTAASAMMEGVWVKLVVGAGCSECDVGGRGCGRADAWLWGRWRRACGACAVAMLMELALDKPRRRQAPTSRARVPFTKQAGKTGHTMLLRCCGRLSVACSQTATPRGAASSIARQAGSGPFHGMALLRSGLVRHAEPPGLISPSSRPSSREQHAIMQEHGRCDKWRAESEERRERQVFPCHDRRLLR